MALKVFNTLSRRLELFEPLEPGRVGLYTCGPTVYNVAHIGNFRAYLFEDLLRRYLEHLGFEVFQVMNLTDVDDKTIRGATEAGLPLDSYTQPFKDAFFEDIRELNIKPAQKYPAATEHIPEMIALIEKLFQAGVAYRSEDGSVYFSIQKFPGYGKLAHLDLTTLKPGARVGQDEYQKDNLADFALWKAWSEEDGTVGWDSPWGKGRPGWHMECSAMSMKYLGPSFDIHTGGVDNIFPHHEDEIAQSEAATGQQFVKYWMHCAHLVVDGRKMSKSLGNFYTLRDILQRGYSGREVRYTLLTAHYRQVLDFSFAALDAARAALGRLDEMYDRVQTIANTAMKVSGQPDFDWIKKMRLDFSNALNDDLNMPEALAALFDWVREVHKRLDAGLVCATGAKKIMALWQDLEQVLGFLEKPTELPDEELLHLAEARARARKNRDWSEADRLRNLVEARGWLIQDGAHGFQLKKK